MARKIGHDSSKNPLESFPGSQRLCPWPGEEPAIKPTVPAGIQEVSTASLKSESGKDNVPDGRTFMGTLLSPELPATQYPLSERDSASWPVGTERPQFRNFSIEKSIEN
jgi:hypothetical protein